jgi:hypothetical protein
LTAITIIPLPTVLPFDLMNHFRMCPTKTEEIQEIQECRNKGDCQDDRESPGAVTR